MMNYNKTKICSICGKPFTTYGNNPKPFNVNEVCCDYCNTEYVIMTRRFLMDYEFDSIALAITNNHLYTFGRDKNRKLNISEIFKALSRDNFKYSDKHLKMIDVNINDKKYKMIFSDYDMNELFPNNLAKKLISDNIAINGIVLICKSLI